MYLASTKFVGNDLPTFVVTRAGNSRSLVLLCVVCSGLPGGTHNQQAAEEVACAYLCWVSAGYLGWPVRSLVP